MLDYPLWDYFVLELKNSEKTVTEKRIAPIIEVLREGREEWGAGLSAIISQLSTNYALLQLTSASRVVLLICIVSMAKVSLAEELSSDSTLFGNRTNTTNHLLTNSRFLQTPCEDLRAIFGSNTFSRHKSSSLFPGK